MTAQELADRILAEIAAGTVDPNAVVVRPFCMCDQDVGYIETQYLDQVVRRFEQSANYPGHRLYRSGDSELSQDAAVTLKLG